MQKYPSLKETIICTTVDVRGNCIYVEIHVQVSIQFAVESYYSLNAYLGGS